MKALVKQQAAPGIWLEDIPEPKVGPNDVMIEIAKTAICGTDMHIYNWDAWAQKTIPVPMAVGHEYCGRIVEIGSEVKGLNTGDRVSGEGHITCGYCRNSPRRAAPPVPQHHRRRREPPRAFAQFLSIPADNTFDCPSRSAMTSPRSWTRLAMPRTPRLAFSVVGEDVLITGAGPIGIMATAVAPASAVPGTSW
jgi:threonine 3-dehydrogenase